MVKDCNVVVAGASRYCIIPSENGVIFECEKLPNCIYTGKSNH